MVVLCNVIHFFIHLCHKEEEEGLSPGNQQYNCHLIIALISVQYKDWFINLLPTSILYEDKNTTPVWRQWHLVEAFGKYKKHLTSTVQLNQTFNTWCVLGMLIKISKYLQHVFAKSLFFGCHDCTCLLCVIRCAWRPSVCVFLAGREHTVVGFQLKCSSVESL